MNYILKTKLFVPQYSTNNLPRQRLVRKINQGIKNKVTLITAPAGFGKTTLVTEWANQTKLPVCWYSLDPKDNDLVTFFSYIVAALSEVDESIRELALGLGPRSEENDAQEIVIPIINDVARIKRDVVLVLDDFHTISQRKIINALCYLIEHCPPNLHLIIVSRTEPKIPCSSLIVRGEMVQISGDELRFNIEEGKKKIKLFGEGKISEDDLEILLSKTEGWAAALQLVNLALEETANSSEYINAFSGITTEVSDYLLDEVISHLPDEIFEFILVTSLLNQFTAELCSVVFERDDASTMLLHLEKAHLFLIPLDNQREWFRFHHLFSDHLRNRLDDKSVKTIRKYHKRAAKWFVDQGIMSEAIYHANLADDTSLLATVIKKGADEQWARGRFSTLERWLQMLPMAVIKEDIELSLLFSWVNYILGEKPLMDLGLAWADEIIETESVSNIPSRLLGIHASIKMREHNNAKEYSKAISLANKALNLLHQDEKLWRIATSSSLAFLYFNIGQIEMAENEAKRSLYESKQVDFLFATMTAYSRLAKIATVKGKLSEAIKITNAGFAHSKEKIGRRTPALGDLFYQLAKVYYEQNNIPEMEKNLSQIDVLRQREANVFPLIQMKILRSKVFIETGKTGEADKIIDEIDQLLALTVTEFHQHKTKALRALLCLHLDQNEQALDLTLSYMEDILGDIFPVHEIEFVAIIEALIANDDLQQAMAVVEILAKSAKEKLFGDLLIKVLLYRAGIEYELGNFKEMGLTLDEVMYRAEEEQYTRIFVTKGERMLKTFEKYRQGDGRNTRFVRNVIQELEAEISGDSDILDLTERELEVLELLAQGQTNKKIGKLLIISAETVNNHNRKIFAKLGVNSRNRAVARAEELSLLK